MLNNNENITAVLENKNGENLTIQQKLSLLAGKKIDGMPFISVAKQHKLCHEPIGGIVYPSLDSIANSFNPKLIGEISNELASRAKNNNSNAVVAPDTSVKMSVYSFGMAEDPCLCGQFALAYKKGIDNAGVMPILSNCSINSADVELMDLEVNKSFIRDYIVRPFKFAGGQTSHGAVMTSARLLKGKYRDVNINLINKNFNGSTFKMHSVCEITDSQSAIECMRAGNTLLLNGNEKPIEDAYNSYLKLKKKFEKGTISLNEFENACKRGDVLSEETLNTAVVRYLKFAADCQNCYDTENISKNESVIITKNQSKNESAPTTNNQNKNKPISINELSLQASEESTVLLKNFKNILPLKSVERIAVIGKIAVLEKPNLLSFMNLLNSTRETLPFKYTGFAAGYNFSALKSDAAVSNNYNNKQKTDAVISANNNNKQADDALISEACSLALSADTVLLFLGLDECQKEDIQTLQSLKLPANQLALIDALAKTGKNIVAIISAEYPLDTSFDDNCGAVILTPSGGIYSSDVLLNILSGALNPSGKLAYTLYDNPQEYFSDLKKHKDSGNIKVGAFFGYRYYDTAQIKVKYPFGHGLSYTDFLYTRIKVDMAGVEFSIKNTGRRSGYETIQVYVGKTESNVARPKKELVCFQRIFLEPGQSVLVNANINYDDYAFCDNKDGERKVEEGEYTVYVCSSVSDVRLKKKIYVHGCKFGGTKEYLTDYMPTTANISRGSYTFNSNERYPTDKIYNKKVSKLNIFLFSMIIFAGFCDIFFPSIFVVYGSDEISISIMICLTILVPFEIMGITLNNKKRRKQNYLMEEIRTVDRRNEIQLDSEIAIEKLFTDEFAEIEDSVKILQQPEIFEPILDAKITVQAVAHQLTVLMHEKGIAVEFPSMRAVLAALYSSNKLVLKSEDIVLLEEFVSYLSGYFEKSENFGGIIEIAESGRNQITENRGNQIQENRENQITESSINERRLQTENATVIEVKLHNAEKAEELSVVTKLSFNQFLKLCQESEKSFTMSEKLYNKLDKLEEYVCLRGDYRFSNKQWRAVEKFMSVFLACEGNEVEAADIILSANLLPEIISVIGLNPSAEAREFLLEFRKEA